MCMICIKTITDEDFGLKSIKMNNPRIRYGARGIILNDENKIGILYKRFKNEYKLIGGGIEEDEDPKRAFRRETLEEAGCVIEINECLGTIEEIKSLDNFKQISYIYIASVTENTNNVRLTEKEIGEGAECLWLSIDDAMNKIKECEGKLLPSQYDGEKSIYHTKFIVRRDYEILKYFKKMFI